jgi:hypothetical protein
LIYIALFPRNKEITRIKIEQLPPTDGLLEQQMKQSLIQETYPVFTLEVDKSETSFETVDGILDFLKEKIENHRAATYITTFDHHAHTSSLQEGKIDKAILDAKNIIFCFGFTIPNPQVLGLRPRSIGVAETEDSFVISFMEAPMPVANVAMETWAMAIRNNFVDAKKPATSC